MDDRSQQLMELDDNEANALAERALESEYVDRLETFLVDERGVDVPTEDTRAFERSDGLQVVSVSADSSVEDRPAVAMTVHFEDGDVVQATTERHDPVAEGTVELAFPSELAPDPEAAVTDILEPDGQSVTVTVDEVDDVTVYLITL
ncbi:hypothetical protein SAMN04487967_2972 [Natronorubrum sediminis]|uniref:Uncharacterized protein n=1 Tax=Natronorubrum sediminis TaxID=640943 RepID=A0A1H6G3B8_9EURY|nr:hypothetical protein [Natronorubrum sediminis]SEH17090.1 hypothetical protein SAMN04487967_2972 [Natronorubrum sediminis]